VLPVSKKVYKDTYYVRNFDCKDLKETTPMRPGGKVAWLNNIKVDIWKYESKRATGFRCLRM
jgi:hypothetical protein